MNHKSHKTFICELPDKHNLKSSFMEEVIKHPGEIINVNDKNYITVEQVNHYFFDGVKYQFSRRVLYVKALEQFC